MLANLQPDQVPSAMKSSILFSDPSLPLAVRSFFRAVRRFGCSTLVLPADAARAVALLGCMVEAVRAAKRLQRFASDSNFLPKQDA